MDGLIMAAQLILGLSILVTLHELGHFWAARAFGIKVEKFYLFFDAWGYKLFSFKKGDTEYGIGWLPFGGYVKIAGMVDESMDKEQMKLPPQPWEFRSKPAWQRLIVMVAGVTMNAILGVILFAFILYHYKQAYLPNESVNNGIYAYDLGREVGLKTGDKIIEIDGKPVVRFEDLLGTKVLFGADLTVIREGKTIHINIPDNFYKTAGKSKGRFIGPDRIPFQVDSVVKGTAADSIGLMKGDRIVAFNNSEINVFGDLKEKLSENAGKTVSLSVIRGNDTIVKNPVVSKDGTIGFVSSQTIYKTEPYTLASSIKYGASEAVNALVSNAKGLGKIFKGEEKASDSVQGPIGIAKIYGGTWDWPKFWSITGLLSMILAFMNILPIPALDGGHIIFLLIEAITGKKFSETFMERAQIIGMIILLSLMVFAVGNDIFKLFQK